MYCVKKQKNKKKKKKKKKRLVRFLLEGRKQTSLMLLGIPGQQFIHYRIVIIKQMINQVLERHVQRRLGRTGVAAIWWQRPPAGHFAEAVYLRKLYGTSYVPIMYALEKLLLARNWLDVIITYAYAGHEATWDGPNFVGTEFCFQINLVSTFLSPMAE